MTSRALERLAKSLSGDAEISFDEHRAELFVQKSKTSINRMRSAYRQLVKSLNERSQAIQGIEVLLDNFYIVDGALTNLLLSWKRKESLRVPQSSDTEGEKRPRAYLIARALVKETDANIKRETILQFLHAYQKSAPLSIRELNIFPDMLRFALIEELLRLVEVNLLALQEIAEAEKWYERIIRATNRKDAPIRLKKLTVALSREYAIIPQTLGLHLLHRLVQAGQEGDTRSVSKWLKLSLSKQGVGASQLTAMSTKAERVQTATVSNAISSLRYLSQVRWDKISDELNMVDVVLAKDTAGLFPFLTDDTRSQYHFAIARIADRTGTHDIEVAREAVKLARQGNDTKEGKLNYRAQDVGYYLVENGVARLEQELGYVPKMIESVRSYILNHNTNVYLGFVWALTLFINIYLFFMSDEMMLSLPLLVVMFIVGMILSSEIAVVVSHFLFTRIIKPRPLPALDMTEGVGPERRTVVVVPSMFRNAQSAKKVLRRMEMNYIANRDPDIFFALLMDFRDATLSEMPGDEERVAEMVQGIQELNERYPSSPQRFSMYYRERKWNPAEKSFMGWERKRGKLREFNELLRGKQTSYVGNATESVKTFGYVRYVITLDEDTELVRDSALALIGTIDHPLNRPVIDEARGVVVKGYGIIEPRSVLRFNEGNTSAFARLFGSFPGMDSYSSLVSDLHQDLFGESLFHGKGIYDIDAIETTMSAERIPDNTVLSHDLLEGIYARVGIANGAYIFEGFPSNYRENALRNHRWVRGDWQIISWLFRTRGGVLTPMSRYRIFDNLRRSLLPVAATLAVIFSAFSPTETTVWSVVAFLALGSGQLVSAILSITERTIDWRSSMGVIARFESFVVGFGVATAKTILLSFFALHTAMLSVDAIFRSMWRLHVSKKKLLEWQTAYEVSSENKNSIRGFVRYMWLSVCAALLLIYFEFSDMIVGGVFSLLWMISWVFAPVFASLLSTPFRRAYVFTEKERLFLYSIAARTYWFFLDLATKDYSWLVPDHLQEDPPSKRHSHGLGISPTNLGMYLLSLSGARELGLSPISEYAERISHAFESLKKMDRYRGHFFNWYELKGLSPLAPKYVSSVDSANLALSLHAVSGGLNHAYTEPIIGSTLYFGLESQLTVLSESIESVDENDLEKQEEKLIEEMRNAVRESLVLVRESITEEITPRRCDLVLSGVIHHAVRTRNALETLRLEGKSQRFESIFLSARHIEQTAEKYRTNISQYLSYAMIPAVSSVVNDEKLHGLHVQFSNILQQIPSVYSLSSRVIRHEIVTLGIDETIKLSKLAPPEKERASAWYGEVLERLSESEKNAESTYQSLRDSADSAKAYAEDMDFKFLYNEERGLFHIGFNSSSNQLDESFYDLLASEANSASIVSIAKNDAPKKHWGYLGRKLIKSSRGDTLVASWAGSLFEYLGTLMYFDAPSESFWGVSAQRAISAHQHFAKRYGIPWGMGESASSRQDAEQNYHYQAFGEPSLGYKRDLSSSIVVAPYTSALSLPLAPKEALLNFARLKESGAFGRYGFYDAIDFTRRRRKKDRALPGVPAQVYYAHHQGFILTSVVNALTDGWVRKMVAYSPSMDVASQLLEEKMPDGIEGESSVIIPPQSRGLRQSAEAVESRRQYIPWRTKEATSFFLSRGKYHTRVTTTGAGDSSFGDIQVTRGAQDMLREAMGTYFFLHDTAKGKTWSPTFMPTKDAGDKHSVSVGEQVIVFEKTSNHISSSLVVTPLLGDEGELRELTVTNTHSEDIDLLLGICAEISLSRGPEETSHPNYEHLFISSEKHWGEEAILAWRPDPHNRNNSVVAGFMIVSDGNLENLQAIREKSAFYGSPQSLANPPVFHDFPIEQASHPVNTLDSVAGFVGSIHLRPNEIRRVSLVMLAGKTRDEIVNSLKKYRNHKLLNTIAQNANQEGARSLTELGITAAQASAYSTLASLALSRTMNSGEEIEESAKPWILSSWKVSVPGTHPIIMLSVTGVTDLPLIRQILSCHSYFAQKGIAVDIVIFNNHSGGYLKTFEDEIDFLLNTHRSKVEDSMSKILHVRTELLSELECNAIRAQAALRIDSKKGTLFDSVSALQKTPAHVYPAKIKTSPEVRKDVVFDVIQEKSTISDFANGFGGYDKENGEYVIQVNGEKRPPRPWSNIVANEHIGFLTTDRGMSFTWARNSYDNKLTVAYNDPLSENSAESVYIRNDETGEYFSPMPNAGDFGGEFEIRYAEKQSSFQSCSFGVDATVSMSIDSDHPVKYFRIHLRNTEETKKTLSLFGYFEILIGSLPPETKKHFSFTQDQKGTLIIQQNYRHLFVESRTFAGVIGGCDDFSVSREEFLGRFGCMREPIALSRSGLSSETNPHGEPALTLRKVVELNPNQEAIVIFFLGQTDELDLTSLLKKIESKEYGEKTTLLHQGLSKNSHYPSIKLPDASLALLANRFLPQQFISSRIHARLGFYQIGGAYGFRDQLQDALAMLWIDPSWVRNHILSSARHQFREGDVLSWWQPHNDFGARTRLSDPQLWLPYVTLRYIEFTGDSQILDEEISYLSGEIPDKADRPNVVGIFYACDEKSSLYEHLIRAVEHSLTSGSHGLPLMGLADWNDGMNNIGVDGEGESVWLAWFTVVVLDEMIPLVEQKGDIARSDRYRQHVKQYRNALEKSGWDGRWYRRAFTDTGALVGTSGAKAFRIDSISQSWAYFANGATKNTRQALQSAKDELSIFEGHVPLAWPPSSRSTLDMGTVSDYPKGVRENASQYNHAALWFAQALFALGDADSGKIIVDAVNPFKRSETEDKATIYQGEPYSVSAEIYSDPTYPGRAGWTWYTASAGVLYRTILESILGLRRKGDTLSFAPSFPSSWKDASVTLTIGLSYFHIRYEISSELKEDIQVIIDKHPVPGGVIALVDDGKIHNVTVVIKKKPESIQDNP